MINSLSTQLTLLKSLLKDYTIPIYSTTPLPAFIKFLRSQKALVSAYLSTQFHQHRVDSIEYYTALRDEHFSMSPDSFISSALSVEHRSIVLDRVLVVIDSKPTLLTDPSDIKQAAIKHFQSVVTPPLVQYSSIDSFPPRWQRAYTPLFDIDTLLYNSVFGSVFRLLLVLFITKLFPWKDLRPAIPLRSILPKDLFTSMKNVRNNFGTRFLAQLVSPCGSRLLSWKDLRFLKRVSNKGSVPAWFTYLFNLIVIPNSPSFFILQQFRISSSYTVASILFIDISRNYWFNPQWAISFNRNTNSFLVGRVITTYPAPRNEALISHWIASSVDDLLSDFTACQGCASALPRSSTSKTLLKRCPSEKCFSYVSLSTLIRYPTKPRTYIHADTRSVSLSASLGYAKSLLLFHLFAPDRLLSTNEQVPRISDIQLPSSVSTLYIDGSFLSPPSHPVSSMAFAWTAIDPDGFILESHYNNISSIFPSALRSEVFALLHGLDSLPQNSKITVATDCAQLLSLWSLYVDAPFIPKLLKEPNHLLWSSIRTIMSQKKLDVSLLK
ncbi:hypothetical protein RhiirA5_404559, partial [Rhizophagus irregularis]